jgi:hypothetical protein
MPLSEWTVEDHLRDKPPVVVALYRRFVELVQACGPFEYAVSKTAITFKGSRRGFAGAKPKAHSLDGYLDLQRRVEDPRVRRASPYTKRLVLQVVAERGGWKPDPDDQEIPVLQERAGGQVMGGRVHRDQLLGTVQEQRAGQDREQDETRAERGAAVDPGGRAQAVGWGRRWRLGVQAGQGRRSVGDGAASAEDA